MSIVKRNRKYENAWRPRKGAGLHGTAAIVGGDSLLVSLMISVKTAGRK
jgi:hypothetical protein